MGEAVHTLSIIIPAYNEEKTIAELLQRVLDADLGSGIERELIVVNDCSTDSTEQIVEDFIAHHADAPIVYLKHEKNYGKGGAEIIADNCQDTIFGGFAPNSQTAETLSKALGSRTVLTGSISKGKDSNSQSLQMAERALLSPDELKSLPKGEFVVMKTGTHPMRTKLQLYFKWGITFEEAYQTPERAQREVYYAGKEELLMNIKKSLYSQPQPVTASKPDGYMSSYGDK